MKRNDIRAYIHGFFEDAKPVSLSEETTEKLKAFLEAKLSSAAHDTDFVVEADYHDFFPSNRIEGNTKRMDPVEPGRAVESVHFYIDSPEEVMVWSDEPFVLNLDMDCLSKDDLVDIKYLGKSPHGYEIDVYKTFLRIPPLKRGLLSSMMEDPMGAFDHEVPPYAFYGYKGQFKHTTDETVDLSGGLGQFLAHKVERGSTLDVDAWIESIGEHAFDGCTNLKEVIIRYKPHYVGKHAFANIPGLVIRCPRLSKKPDNWDDEWCDENCKIIWKAS